MRILTAPPLMREAPASPDRRQRLRRMLLGSALLHLLLLLTLLLYKPPKLTFGTPTEAPSVDMMFESPQPPQQSHADKPAPGAAQQHTEASATPQNSSPSPMALPVPNAVPQPPSAAASPAAPSPELPPQTPSPPTPLAALPDEAPPQVSLDLPPDDDGLVLASPEPPPPLEPLPLDRPPARAAPRAQPRIARQATPGSSLSAPMDLSFAQNAPPPGNAGRRHQRGIDMAMAPKFTGGQIGDAVAHLSAPGATKDWEAELRSWVELHKYYPEIAGQNGQEGAASVSVTVLHDGTVQDVHLVNSAGSKWLDIAWVSVFRGRKVPPLPDDMHDQTFTFEFTMDYILIHQ